MVKKTGTIKIEIGKPLRFAADAEMPAHAEPLLDAIGKTFRRYREALKDLLNGRYAHAKGAVSWHMREPCDITLLRCIDGIIVRYDAAASEKPVIRIGRIVEADSLELLAPLMSDHVLHFPSDPTEFQPSGLGPRMTLGIHNQNGSLQQEVVTVAPIIVASSRWPEGVAIPTPPSRPPCLASIVNEFEVQLGGMIVDASPPSAREIRPDPTNFLAVSRFQLPVGWRAIEVYPPLGIEYWNPGNAPAWAENDLLFGLLQKNAREGQLLALDGRVAARKKCLAMLAEFAALLNGPEEPVHQFLKKIPYCCRLLTRRHGQKFRSGTESAILLFARSPTITFWLKLRHPTANCFGRMASRGRN